MSKKKGCDFKIDSRGKPHCSSNKTGIIDDRCYIPKKNCSVKPHHLAVSSVARKPVAAPVSAVGAPVSAVAAPVSESVTQAAEPVHSEAITYPWTCECGYTQNNDENCVMCTRSKSMSKIFDGFTEPWVCLRCFQINAPAPPGKGCIKCGENSTMFLISNKPARRPVRDCDQDYCRESQINSWCFKHAINNLIKKHKYFVGEFDGPIIDKNQINVMGVCKMKSAEILGDAVSLQEANQLLQLCGPTVNLNIAVALEALSIGGYGTDIIYEPVLGTEADIDYVVNSKINEDYLANPQLLGFLLRVTISDGDPNTNHFTVIRKDSNCEKLFKYVESRDFSVPGSSPVSMCLRLEVGQGVLKHFLLSDQIKNRIKTIIAVYKS